jgi:hypothetical protein
LACPLVVAVVPPGFAYTGFPSAPSIWATMFFSLPRKSSMSGWLTLKSRSTMGRTSSVAEATMSRHV